MGKASQRKRASRASSNDVHERIAEEAKLAKEAPDAQFVPDATSPELAALIASARRRIEKAIPVSFVHEGREYWCCISIGIARLNVFAMPTTSDPLVTSLFGSSDDFGHQPFH